jgi:hypothetical protein
MMRHNQGLAVEFRLLLASGSVDLSLKKTVLYQALHRLNIEIPTWSKHRMARTHGKCLVSVALILCLIAPRSATAFIYPLQPESVREAYFFGRSTDREKVATFLGQYTCRFEPGSGKPNVGYIELRTPFEQVVLRSSENQTIGYSAQQAQIDYDAQPGSIAVRVFLYLSSGGQGRADLYSDSEGRVLDRRENFWREFRFRVTQERVIEPTKLEGKPIYSRRGKGLSGAEVWLEFDASQFASGMARVEVTAPDQQAVAAEFNLDELK